MEVSAHVVTFDNSAQKNQKLPKIIFKKLLSDRIYGNSNNNNKINKNIICESLHWQTNIYFNATRKVHEQPCK